MILEKLQKYSGADLQTCEAQLAKRDGNFWFALHDLLKPTDKDALVLQLYTATQAEELYELLSKLERVYSNSDFYDVVMNVFDDDREILQSHKLHGVDALNDLEPTDQEVNRYAELLRSFVPKVADKARKVVGKIRAEHFPPEIIALFKQWMKGTNEYMIKEVFSTNVHDQPDKIGLFLDEIAFNLEPGRETFHFTALRALTSDNAPCYPRFEGNCQIARYADRDDGQ
jgi:hypothetical protein